MSAYLTEKVLPALRGKHGEPLLAEFVRRGENHAIMNKWHQKFFMYLVSIAVFLFVFLLLRLLSFPSSVLRIRDVA